MPAGGLAEQKAFGGGQPGSGVYGGRVRPRSCQVRKPLPYPGHGLSASVSPEAPPKGSQLLISLLLPPLSPYLVFQPFSHSPASSAPPEVTR